MSVVLLSGIKALGASVVELSAGVVEVATLASVEVLELSVDVGLTSFLASTPVLCRGFTTCSNLSRPAVLVGEG